MRHYLILYAIMVMLSTLRAIDAPTDWRQYPAHMVKSDAELDANQATQLYRSFKRFQELMEQHHQPKPFFEEAYRKAAAADAAMIEQGSYNNDSSVLAEFPTKQEMFNAWKHWATMIKYQLIDFDAVVDESNFGEDNSATVMHHITQHIECDIAQQRYFLVPAENAIKSGEMSFSAFKTLFYKEFVEQPNDERWDYLSSTRNMINNYMGDFGGGIYPGFKDFGIDSEALLKVWYIHARAEIILSAFANES